MRRSSIIMGKTKVSQEQREPTWYQKITGPGRKKEATADPATIAQIHAPGTTSLQHIIEYNSPEYWALRVNFPSSKPPISLAEMAALEKVLGYDPKIEQHDLALSNLNERVISQRFVPLDQAPKMTEEYLGRGIAVGKDL